MDGASHLSPGFVRTTNDCRLQNRDVFQQSALDFIRPDAVPKNITI